VAQKGRRTPCHKSQKGKRGPALAPHGNISIQIISQTSKNRNRPTTNNCQLNRCPNFRRKPPFCYIPPSSGADDPVSDHSCRYSRPFEDTSRPFTLMPIGEQLLLRPKEHDPRRTVLCQRICATHPAGNIHGEPANSAIHTAIYLMGGNASAEPRPPGSAPLQRAGIAAATRPVA
jgi:hypothetical protein